MFNRGQTNPNLFPRLELIRGDRDPRTRDLSGLNGNRRWDAVIDVWPDDPEIVAATARLLVDRTHHYAFVSSIAVYADFFQVGLDETSATRIRKPGYGGNKARAEEQLRGIAGDEAAIARCAAIMGPRDTAMSFYYWLSKLASGQAFVAPGTGADPLQFVDVRDVAAWIIDSAERRRRGTFNTFSRPTPFRTFLGEAAIGMHAHPRPIWVNGDFLREREKVRPFDSMPVWHPDEPGFARIVTSKAVAAGFKQRPIRETARDTWSWYRSWVPANLEFPQKDGSYEWGISRARELAILRDWHAYRAS